MPSRARRSDPEDAVGLAQVQQRSLNGGRIVETGEMVEGSDGVHARVLGHRCDEVQEDGLAHPGEFQTAEIGHVFLPRCQVIGCEMRQVGVSTGARQNLHEFHGGAKEPGESFGA